MSASKASRTRLKLSVLYCTVLRTSPPYTSAVHWWRLIQIVGYFVGNPRKDTLIMEKSPTLGAALPYFMGIHRRVDGAQLCWMRWGGSPPGLFLIFCRLVRTLKPGTPRERRARRCVRQGVIRGGRVTNYLLEKSRVTGQADGERCFHVLHYLLEGASSVERREYQLLCARCVRCVTRRPWKPAAVCCRWGLREVFRGRIGLVARADCLPGFAYRFGPVLVGGYLLHPGLTVPSRKGTAGVYSQAPVI